ncbi:MAG: hypothetical protein FIB07_06090 [Candidatus Methanoperedens sp.]|nr:hypothetical protein [Candidatus Methanoperedens sp.]
MKNNIKYIILLFSLTFIINQVSAAEVKIIPLNQTVTQGDIFDLNITIDPQGPEIAGAQLNVEFNNSMLSLNNVIEGEFFKQNGASTLFNTVILNNPGVTSINVYSAILGPYNVSSPGTFLTINVTATGSHEQAGIYLSSVQIVDPAGNYVPANVINGNVNINSSSDTSIRYINGTVLDSVTKAGIIGVDIFTNTSISTTTDASGFYSLAVPDGTYDITVKFDPEYYPNSTTVSTTSSVVVMQDFELVKKPTGTITGIVTHA